ncbi:TadE/TadG family type IV pilus assembly protein [Phaeobacter marinintestinus]|uniref:TadE/TadG family type IV pilus assembly protein n=1 Tax=Falsiphaeobacter marinintestinus TaxID=1492905 RepID=UPI0011B810A0|nr:pilus assembly protein [Phaeobacter marinintestinus]
MKLVKFRQYAKSFLSGTDGNVTIEFVMVMPFLFWAFMASYVFFDGFRQSTLNVKAAYTISDLISRETQPINDDYVDSMVELMEAMTRSRSQVRMRISVIRWDEEDNRYYVDWSATRGLGTERTDETISHIRDQLPSMPDDERVILVETANKFIPLYNIGMDDKNLKNIVFTRPRFAPQVVWSDS